LPFLENTFDVVVCTQVLEHIKGDLKALKEIGRVLKSGGKFILAVPVPPQPVMGDVTDSYDAHQREGYKYDEIKTYLQNLRMDILSHEFFLFIFARWAFKIIAFFDQYFKIRPPDIFIAILSLADRLFSLIFKIKPFGLLISAKKI